MNNAVKVGLFMFVVLVVAGVFIIKIEDIPIGSDAGRRITVIFPDVAGLDEKSAVRVAGVRVGKVERIRLEGTHAEVVLLVDGNLSLSKGARAAVRNMGLLGDKYVELIPGDLSLGILTGSQKLEGLSPVSYDRILELLASIGEDVKELTVSFEQTIGGEEGQARLDRIVQNVEDFTSGLTAMVAENREVLNSTMQNINGTTSDLKTRLPGILEGVQLLVDELKSMVSDNRSKVDHSMSQVQEASERLNGSLESLQSILEGLDRGEGSVGKLLKDPAAHDSLVKTLDSVKGGADSVTETLGRVRNWDLDLSFKGEYLVDVEETKTYFGLMLTPRSDRFYMLELVDDPMGKRKEKDKIVTTVNQDGSMTTETTSTISYDDTFTITAMFGWRLNKFNLRGGMIQSRGGVGVDFFPVEKKLCMSVEVFDFSRDQEEDFHLKMWGRYYLSKHFYLVAGWDDILSETHDSVFFGGGLSIRDDDFKYLLGSGIRP